MAQKLYLSNHIIPTKEGEESSVNLIKIKMVTYLCCHLIHRTHLLRQHMHTFQFIWVLFLHYPFANYNFFPQFYSKFSFIISCVLRGIVVHIFFNQYVTLIAMSLNLYYFELIIYQWHIIFITSMMMHVGFLFFHRLIWYFVDHLDRQHGQVF